MLTQWIWALAGGALIGIAATILLLFNGRITGISGIFFGLIHPLRGDTLWRAKFVLGLLVGGIIGSLLLEDAFYNSVPTTIPMLILAGFLVGFGTRLGGGCTSGHGVCGISRMSPRSLLATGTFIAAGIITVKLFHG